jgi:phosphoadenosine phosphosulfate reductase
MGHLAFTDGPVSEASRTFSAQLATASSERNSMNATPSATASSPPSAELIAELDGLQGEFETAPPGKVVAWAVERFGTSMVLACSFQDIVLVDIAVAVDPKIEVVFLDTHAHFPETLAFVDEVAERYGLNLTVTHPGPEADAAPCGTDQCCALRKVAPLRKAVAGRQAWMTALKRVDATTRTVAPVVAFDENFGVVKINPMATWTDDDIAGYLADHQLPLHPLVSKGYVSIGCAPTTRPIAVGEDPRSGRWSGSDKTECGLHA